MILPRPAPRWLDRADRWTTSHGWAADALLALACAAVLGALSLSAAQNLHWSTGWAVALAVCFAALHLTVALRGHAPELAFALAAAAMLGVVLAPDGRVIDRSADEPPALPALFLPSTLLFLLALFSVAAHARGVRSRIALGIALAGVVLATVSTADVLRNYAGGWLTGLYFGLVLLVGVLLTWNLGRFGLVRRERAIAERAESARLAVLEERNRIARDMHDVVAHSLAVIVRQAEGGAFVADQDPQRAAQALRTIADAGRSALVDMRGLVGVLRDSASASDVPQPTLADLPELVSTLRNTGVDAELVESGASFPVSAATELAVYRLAQEGLTNAVKHAGPGARVAVAVCWRPAMLDVEVADDGGAAAGPPVPGAGAGLPGLRERVAAVGGTFSADRVDRGFRIRAHFPRATAGSAR